MELAQEMRSSPLLQLAFDASSIVPEPLHITLAVTAVVGFDESIYFAAAFIQFFSEKQKT